MRQITMLNSDMFNDGSLESYNFVICDEEGSRQVDASFIDELGLRELVEARMKINESYLNTSNMGLVYAGLRILEIQWG